MNSCKSNTERDYVDINTIILMEESRELKEKPSKFERSYWRHEDKLRCYKNIKKRV